MKHMRTTAALLALAFLLAGCAPGAGEPAAVRQTEFLPPAQADGQASPAGTAPPMATPEPAPEGAQPAADEARAYAAIERAGKALGLPIDGYTAFERFDNAVAVEGAAESGGMQLTGDDANGCSWVALIDSAYALRALCCDLEQVYAALTARGAAFDGLDEGILTDHAPYETRARGCAEGLFPGREIAAVGLRTASMEGGMPRVEMQVSFADGQVLQLRFVADADKTPYELWLMEAEFVPDIPAKFIDQDGRYIDTNGERGDAA